MKLHPGKCHVGYGTLEVLGHIVTPQGRTPVRDKIEAITKVSPPTDVHEVRRFLGMTGYYRRYIRNYSHRAKALTELTKKKKEWTWGTRQQAAFNSLC